MTLPPYRDLPAVHQLLGTPAALGWLETHSRQDVVAALQEALFDARERLRGGELPDLSQEVLLKRALECLHRRTAPSLRAVVNATGTVLHTNLGRAPLAQEALQAMRDAAEGYSNLEFDLGEGERGHRYELVEPLICELTGAEAAFVVNNNAAAVFLMLRELAEGRKVAVSRGELVEIGGSFRVSEVMRASGAQLVEVGTTNKTHLRDYEKALDDGADLVLRVHTSNFRIVGFTHAPPLEDLVALSHSRGVPVMEDLGSGSLLDLRSFGIGDEPTIRDSLAAGVDLVTFSGDKLLGGAQAGILCGRRGLMERIRANQLARVVRVDKLTLAALEATLRLYRDDREAVRKIPALRMLTTPKEELRSAAEKLDSALSEAVGGEIRSRVVETVSKVGGGALPTTELPTYAVAVAVPGLTAGEFLRSLRSGDPPVVARVSKEEVIFDVRTLLSGQAEAVVEAVRSVLGRRTGEGAD